jgi:hypothetical protein
MKNKDLPMILDCKIRPFQIMSSFLRHPFQRSMLKRKKKKASRQLDKVLLTVKLKKLHDKIQTYLPTK